MAGSTPPEQSQELPEVFDASGEDLSLIRWMLALTPRERLRQLQRYINSVRRLQDARRAAG
jgi:hypothetical protein